MSRLPLALLALALVLGAGLRFADLGALQMSADEGATWAAAHAPTIAEVVALQQTHNPGKLPLHDLMLHEWIAMFGEGMPAMRSLSALFGLLAVLLMFPATRELFRVDASLLVDYDIDLIAALSALICAVSLITIKYSREARMYGVLLAISIAQVWFFLRSLRRSALSDYLLLTILTAALIAVNLVTTPMLAAEGLWLIFIVLTRAGGSFRRSVASAFSTGAAMAAGLLLLSPALYVLFSYGSRAVSEGKVNWLPMPPWWAPAAFFNKATGSLVFPVMIGLAGWGIWRGWGRAKRTVMFSVLWMWAPPLLLLIGSHLWRPMFVERYAFYSFPPFFILAAIGIRELDSTTARVAAAAAVVLLSLGHIYSYAQKAHDADWHEAARVATATLAPDDTVAVVPDYAVEVVRYYMIPQTRDHASSFTLANGTARVVILADHGVNSVTAARVRRQYPRPLARPRGLAVLSR